MRIHKVKECCCGCSLATGSMVIAWLQMISGVIVALIFITLLVILDFKTHTIDHINQLYKLANMSNIDGDNFTFPTFEDEEDIPLPNFGLCVSYSVVGVFVIILGMILLLGASNRRPHLLNIWIVISLIGLILYGISIFIQVIFVMIGGMYVAGVVSFLSSLAGLLLSYYYVMVVSSYRKQIMSGNNAV